MVSRVKTNPTKAGRMASTLSGKLKLTQKWRSARLSAVPEECLEFVSETAYLAVVWQHAELAACQVSI
jgi:hypothetical protein